MKPTTDDSAHLGEGTLLQLIDREAVVNGEHALAHLTACAGCAERLEALRARSEAVRRQLRAAAPLPLDDVERARARKAIDEQLRRRRTAPGRWHSPAWRVAAGLLLVSGAAMAEPVRSWVMARLSRPDATRSPASAPSTPGRSAPVQPEWLMLAYFDAEGPELSIRVAAPQRLGTLEIRGGAGRQTSAGMAGGSGQEDLLVLPSALHVRNDSTSTASYLVTTGASVRRVRVSVGTDRDTALVVAPGSVARVLLAPRP